MPNDTPVAPTGSGHRQIAEQAVYEALTGRYPCFDADDVDEERIAREDAQAAVAVLRALPVEVRMEAMGMVPRWTDYPIGFSAEQLASLGHDPNDPHLAVTWIELDHG